LFWATATSASIVNKYNAEAKVKYMTFKASESPSTNITGIDYQRIFGESINQSINNEFLE